MKKTIFLSVTTVTIFILLIVIVDAIAICPDVNSNRIVDAFDLEAVNQHVGEACWSKCKNADINSDGKVDIKDLALVGSSYNSVPGDPNWDPRADTNNDSVINIMDQALVGLYYGKVCYNETFDLNRDCVVNETDTEIVNAYVGETCCINGTTNPCGTNIGACENGTQTCVYGFWGECEGNIGPKNETCNGLDDDCDGVIDKGCECTPPGINRTCGIDIGVCKSGYQTCKDGKWDKCMGNIGPTKEICDSEDNDCDGSTDEGLIIRCSSNSECSPDGCYSGSYRDYFCVNLGSCFSNCSYSVVITDNDGDGYDIECDNDCNDNNLNINPGAEEVCDDSKDNDCDGLLDSNDVDCKEEEFPLNGKELLTIFVIVFIIGSIGIVIILLIIFLIKKIKQMNV